MMIGEIALNKSMSASVQRYSLHCVVALLITLLWSWHKWKLVCSREHFQWYGQVSMSKYRVHFYDDFFKKIVRCAVDLSTQNQKTDWSSIWWQKIQAMAGQKLMSQIVRKFFLEWSFHDEFL